MNALKVSNVGYSYEDGTVALEAVSLSLEEGDKVAIVGPNGAGKSTLLHLISGFRTPYTGEVQVCGKTLDRHNADLVRKDLGIVFQDPDDQLFMPTVEEDVAFGPRNLGLEDVEGRVSRALESAGIAKLAKRRPHRLSYGMKKRVAIAGILAMDPKVLLLDEPTSGLDPRSRTDLIRLLKDMDRTMLIATHDLEAAAEVVDRAVVLKRGIVMEGTMRDLVMATDVIEKSGLEIPPISKLFKVLGALGYPVDALPVSMDQAVSQMTTMIDEGGRPVHAHIHGHEGGSKPHVHRRGKQGREMEKD
jgi:cobalt/nickel transport system ATP-binding protein